MFSSYFNEVVGLMHPSFAGTETAMRKHQTSLEKIENIERKKDEAVLAREFSELGGEDQVSRALRTLLLRNAD
ncbi:hypothetical protein [Bradyrhizobium sp. 131]|uniref:hypothetical protein n=1 Tax=Bradyrhizobium sp. 131 TaxID=2782609 RepID=UPI001FFF7615|nr:hypothetical protein [Bradyrhizobium sp. 131]UPK20310.1 hypothetical protein IVA73_04015 [Bradyrhizobium sp. 131]